MVLMLFFRVQPSKHLARPRLPAPNIKGSTAPRCMPSPSPCLLCAHAILRVRLVRPFSSLHSHESNYCVASRRPCKRCPPSATFDSLADVYHHVSFCLLGCAATAHRSLHASSTSAPRRGATHHLAPCPLSLVCISFHFLAHPRLIMLHRYHDVGAVRHILLHHHPPPSSRLRPRHQHIDRLARRRRLARHFVVDVKCLRCPSLHSHRSAVLLLCHHLMVRLSSIL